MLAPLHARTRLVSSLLLLTGACGSGGDEATKVAPPESRSSKPEANEVVLDLKGAGPAKGSMKAAVTKAVDDAKAVAPDEGTAPDDGSTAGTASASGSGPGSGAAYARFFWAHSDEGKTVIDMIDVVDPSSKEDIVMAIADPHGHPDGIEQVLPEDVALPPGFARGNEWVIAGIDGEHRGKAVAFGAFLGAGESHFTVVLDGEFSGLAARAGDFPGPVPRLRKVELLDLKQGDGKALFDAIRPALAKAGPPSVRKAMGRKRIGAKDLQVVEGRFGGGMTHLIAVSVALRPRDISADRVSGLLLADATGRLEIVHPLGLSMDAYELRYLVDLEGDGQDEVIWDSFYYEGRYAILTGWDAAGARIDRTLTGDGA